MKLPGVAIVYTLFMVLFGQTPAGIHLGLMVVNGICSYLLFLLAKRLFDSKAAVYSCTSYAVLSLSLSVNGVFAHATNFVVLFVLAGFLSLFHCLDKKRIALLFISGLCFGLAVAMKQHAVLLLFYAFLYLLLRISTTPVYGKNDRIAGSFLFVLGAAVPYALIALWMVRSSTFNEFWLWSVQYARVYASKPALSMGLDEFRNSFGKILQFQWPLWLIAGVGCVLLGLKKRGCADRVFVFGFLLFSFLSICPGMHFRGHYFVLLLPAVAIVIGSGTRTAELLLSASRFPRHATLFAILLLIAAISFSFYRERGCFFTLTPQQVSRATYGANPFPEAPQIADYIKRHTSRDDKIAVLGSEPEIFFYADRLSATGHIYMYGLMERQPFAKRMQAQMIGEIESARPKYVVAVNVESSWLIQDSSLRSVLFWGDQYLRKL